MCDPYSGHGKYLFIVVLISEHFHQREVSIFQHPLKWVPLIPALSRLWPEGFERGFGELGGNYDLLGIEAGSCFFFERRRNSWPWKPFDPSVVLPTSQSPWFGAKPRAPMQCSKINLMFFTDNSCKLILVPFLFPCRESGLPLFSVSSRAVSLNRTVTITLNFLYFLGIWKCHWESRDVPSTEFCTLLFILAGSAIRNCQ